MAQVPCEGAKKAGKGGAGAEEILISAKEAWESTKAPQLKNCIQEINKARKAGRTHCYVGGMERLHRETIDALLNVGYDIHVSYYNNMTEGWFNEVRFTPKETGGELTFETAKAKELLAYPGAAKDGSDIRKKCRI